MVVGEKSRPPNSGLITQGEDAFPDASQRPIPQTSGRSRERMPKTTAEQVTEKSIGATTEIYRVYFDQRTTSESLIEVRTPKGLTDAEIADYAWEEYGDGGPRPRSVAVERLLASAATIESLSRLNRFEQAKADAKAKHKDVIESERFTAPDVTAFVHAIDKAELSARRVFNSYGSPNDGLEEAERTISLKHLENWFQQRRTYLIKAFVEADPPERYAGLVDTIIQKIVAGTTARRPIGRKPRLKINGSKVKSLRAGLAQRVFGMAVGLSEDVIQAAEIDNLATINTLQKICKHPNAKAKKLKPKDFLKNAPLEQAK
jgi:hypothetical protein